MMSLGMRKSLVLTLVGLVFVLANLVAITAWLYHAGVIGWAERFRQEFLTGTALTILAALLVLLVGPGRVSASGSSCPVCDLAQRGGRYCKHCGSTRA